MSKTVNESLMDVQVAQAIRWIRLGNREAKEIVRILNSVNDQLTGLIIGSGVGESNLTKRRQEALQKQINDLLDVVHESIAGTVSKTAIDSAVLAAEAEVLAIKNIMPVKLDVITPNLGVLQTAATSNPFNGGILSEWADDLRDNDKKRVWRTVLDGMVQGSSTQDIINNVLGRKSLRYKDGVREVSRRGAQALVRTAINHSTNQGRQMVWDDNSDIVSMVKWVSTLDTRTSSICRFRDGRVGPVSPDPNFIPPKGEKKLRPQMARPPAHPNCRSTTVAVTKSWKELGFDFEELTPETRASMNGYVPADVTYYDWLKGQSKDIQLEVLGSTRYQLWKKGGAEPVKFQNLDGDELSLDDLKKKMPSAFEKAGL